MVMQAMLSKMGYFDIVTVTTPPRVSDIIF